MSVAEKGVYTPKQGEGRYQFYREHKYVSFVLIELERLIAKADFAVPSEVEQIQAELNKIMQLMHFHAEYEESKLHVLLKEKGSNVFQEVEENHQKHGAQFQTLHSFLEQIQATSNESQRIELGYQFFLSYRKFVSENLDHFHEEESIILPELQRLYSDEELRRVEANTYRRMTVEHLTHMVQTLFPHFNRADREAFLYDIQEAVPDKFIDVWDALK
jgi:hemerythrin-like domain-containing protein